jgi:hypothetical protein
LNVLGRVKIETIVTGVELPLFGGVQIFRSTRVAAKTVLWIPYLPFGQEAMCALLNVLTRK